MRFLFSVLCLWVLIAAEVQAGVEPKVYTGQFPCELAQEVTLSADFRYPGRYILQFGKALYTVQRVPTSDGVQDVVRLEDAAKGAVWIQLPYKSMLMSQKLGKRLVDECTSTGQARVAKTMAPVSESSLLSDAQPAVPQDSARSATK